MDELGRSIRRMTPLNVLCPAERPARFGSGEDVQRRLGWTPLPPDFRSAPASTPVAVGMRDLPTLNIGSSIPKRPSLAIDSTTADRQFSHRPEHPATYYIVKINGILRGFNIDEWHVQQFRPRLLLWTRRTDRSKHDTQLCPGQNATPQLCAPSRTLCCDRSTSRQTNPGRCPTLIYWLTTAHDEPRIPNPEGIDFP